MSSNEEEAAGQEANGATQADEAPQAAGERAGDRRPPVATRFKPGESGQPARAAEAEAPSWRGRRQGAARARYGRGDGRARPAPEQARGDGEADCRRRDERRRAGDQALVRAHQGGRTGAERARRRAPGRLASEADAIVIAELRRRFAAGDWLSRAQRSGADPSPPTPLPQGRGGKRSPVAGEGGGREPDA